VTSSDLEQSLFLSIVYIVEVLEKIAYNCHN